MIEVSSSIIELDKVSNRVCASDHVRILERLAFLESIDYVVYGHKSCKFISDKPVFTILLTLHDSNLSYVVQSINSVLEQTYPNTELIILDNGSTGEISVFVEEVFLKNSNCKLLRVVHNLYNPMVGDKNPLFALWNSGLFTSVGDYIYPLSYDDFLSLDYAELMVNLFQENMLCVSASPSVQSVNALGDANTSMSELLRKNNIRNRFESGIYLAENKLKNIDLIDVPGALLAQKSSLVIELGGLIL